MMDPGRTSLTSLLAFLLVVLFAASGGAQSPPPVSPNLANSKPFQRWWWAFFQRAHPLDDIPVGAKLRGLQQTRAATAARARVAPAPGIRWVNIGPAPILGGQIGGTPHARPVSGRVSAIAVDPGDPTHWLIGAAQGGVWETRDAGATWSPKTDDQASLAIGALAFAPSNPAIIYAGTGEAVFAQDAYGGAGLLKSTNGGATWQLLASATFAKTAFSDIKVDPGNPDVVLVATTRDLARAGRGGGVLPAAPMSGVSRSTDGGATWALTLSGEATALEVDPENFTRQYAGLGEPFVPPGVPGINGVYRSFDGGQVWARLPGPWDSLAGGVGRVELALAPSDPNVLYVSIQDWGDGVGTDGGLLGLWRTSNAWDAAPAWTSIPTGATDNGTGSFGYCGWDAAYAFGSAQCWYNHTLTVDPTDPDTLYAGGTPLWKCERCTGPSAAWTEASQTRANPAGGIHVDQHRMAWARLPAPAPAVAARPLSFEPNQGQTDAAVKFLARGRGYTLLLTPTDAVLALRPAAPERRPAAGPARRTASAAEAPTAARNVVRLQLVGANPDPEIVGLDPLPGRSHYFIGNDPGRWRTHVPTYARIHYREVYPGIDLVYYGDQRQLEYDFVVAPGADPSRIALAFEGIEGLEVDAEGHLVVEAAGGRLVWHRPRIYQEVAGARREVAGGYVLGAGRRVGFQVAAYDAGRPLVIDPTLSYSTYLGGSGDDGGFGVAVDATGHVYVAGVTGSPDFPTTAGVVQRTFRGGSTDVFVAKLTPDGSTMLYATYLGGSGNEGGYSIGSEEYLVNVAVDGNGSAYVAGTTGSDDFPTVSAIQGMLHTGNCVVAVLYGARCTDAFVAKLAPDGGALVYSTYLGGSADDAALAIAVDAPGNAYVTGWTVTPYFQNLTGTPPPPDFPTVNAFQQPGPLDKCESALFGSQLGLQCGRLFPFGVGAFAFVAKFNPAGGLVYSTYLGGHSSYEDIPGYGPVLVFDGSEHGHGIAVDTAGNAYVTGDTSSYTFPTLNPLKSALCTTSYAPHCGRPNAFVAKFSPAGGLIYSTYLGGGTVAPTSGSEGYDRGRAIAVDADGQAYVTGLATSVDFPTTVNAFQRIGSGAFVSKVSADGGSLVYSTYLGGSGYDEAFGIAVDAAGAAWVTGYTLSPDFPTTADAFQPSPSGDADAFLTKLDPSGSALRYSTYLGGSGWDGGNGLALNGANVYVTGATGSADFPVANPWQATLGGFGDAFLARFSHPQRLIVGNDGGVWSSLDGGATWIDHNSTLAITQFYDGTLHPTNPSVALGGAQDNGTALWTGASAWQWVNFGDGADNAISTMNPDTHWATSSVNLSIRRTTNGGASFTNADAGINKTGVPFIARFAKCPANDDVFIGGTDNLWRSDDFFSAAATPTWTSNGPEMGTAITAVAFAPSDASCRTYAFGTARGHLRLTRDGGATWQDPDAGNAVPDRYVTGLAFDPTNASILYVTLSGFDEGTPGQPGHVFKTPNAMAAGPTWANASPPVNLPHNAIVVDPLDPSVVYVGADLGVWRSTDGGSTWTHLGPETGMPNVAVFDLHVHPTTGRLVAFTHGRSAFAGTVVRQFTLSVDRTGSGTGTVTSAPAGINCGLLCGAIFDEGTAVLLTARPDPGSLFSRWIGGGCSGIGTCTVTMTADVSVTATFDTMSPGAPGVGFIVTAAGPRGGPDVRVFSGTGSPTSTDFFAYDPGFTGGVFVAVGDLEGSGAAHIITGTGPGGGAHVRAFNLDGSPRATSFLVYAPSFTGGVRLAACDFDGDGRADIVTGAGPTGGPHVRVIKLDAGGQPATDLANFMAYDPGFTGGLFVACADLDGDGVPEIFVGPDAGGGPHVRVFKYTPATPGGATLFFQFFAYAPGFTGGIRVAAGNVDASDRASVITGAGPGGGPHVRVLKWTGNALVELANFFVYDPGFRNGIFVAAGHVSGTGAAGVVTGADAGGGPHVRVFTGTGGDTGISFFAYDPSFTGGVRVGAAP